MQGRCDVVSALVGAFDKEENSRIQTRQYTLQAIRQLSSHPAMVSSSLRSLPEMDHSILPTSAPTPPSVSNAATAVSPPSSPSFLLRVSVFLVLAAFSLWANFEASKGFEIAVINAASDTHAARRFHLLFVSNGRAARLVLSSSDFVERVLYPDDSFPRKPVGRVTLYMAALDLNETVLVSRGRRPGEFVVRMSQAVMGESDVQVSVASAVQRGMARVWLWDGRGRAPRSLLDAMVDYLTVSTGLVSPRMRRNDDSAALNAAPCWAEQDRLCVARMNRAMQEEWNESKLEDACGLPSESCARSSYSSFETV
ncbi:unnamed protein product [Musa acuminata subsp. malaccensis]|uniref:(wild Malaysian banana) hypothetical protein n=1 Tax=Musa acuminata subsp. malaccensis TaxID=214687 RepID=A0A804JGG6_MUSAM|nr:unnamed protein product [Musa acuminata subsp. malaccensis]